ncbi:hypothetical protein [Deinococcus ruber]|uniref:Tetratricopeptide repeat protein n=1 Tax=Deinococcus ruber TaxID=1848197 RepID=A0A918C3X0_9DEIO|nr:hypothetical protein [Deinococcus ruber]GGR03411.1 hypothetical protein GCM10008957_15360 [Deinococcus ruber]
MTLTTLGSLSVSGSTLARPKPLTLIAYLALEGPTPRRRLQELFWPRAPHSTSLRVALHNLRGSAEGAVSGSDLLETHVECDAVQLLAERDPARAFALYSGPFLHGVALPDISSELEDWILETAERIATAAQQGGLRAAAALPAMQRARLAEAAYRLPGAPPLPLNDLRLLSELLTPGSAAEREVQAELAHFGPQLSTPPPPSLTRMLGRQRELNTLLALLGPAQTRLIEVTGPGGIGKTTLVDAALREHAALSGVRIASVDTESVQHPAEVAAAVAAFLRLELRDQGDVWQALALALGTQPTVVALHGTEHLPELTDLAQTLLVETPALQMIITSRIHRAAGAHLHLEGLELPPSGEDEALIRASPAVQLLLREAERIGTPLPFAEHKAALIAAVARRLDGHPLALELAASLAARIPLSRLHDHLLHDAAWRQGQEWSHLRSLFSRSWSLLEDSDQWALEQLSVFADFDFDDAQAAVQVGSAVIERLEAHSLLRKRAGRWQVMPVLAPLVPQRGHSAARAEHTRHYLSLLTSVSPEDPRLAAERSNVNLAVEHAVRATSAPVSAIDALLSHYDRSGLLSAGAQVFARLAELGRETATPPPVLASILTGQAWLALRSSRPRDAERLARQVLDDPALSDVPARMKALNVRASALHGLGQTHDAIHYLREAVTLARQLGDSSREARYLANLGTLAKNVGDYQEGATLLRHAVDLHERSGRTVQALIGRMQLLNLYVDQVTASLEPATSALLEEALFLATQLERRGAVQEASMAQLANARLLLASHLPQESLRAAQRMVEATRQLEFVAFEAAAVLTSAEALYALGRSQEARRAVLRALTLNTATGDVPGIFEAWLTVVADLNDTHPALADQLMNAVQGDPRASVNQRLRAGSRETPNLTTGRCDAALLSEQVLSVLRR